MQQYNLFYNKWTNNKSDVIYIGSLACQPTLLQYELICGMMDNIEGLNLLISKTHLYPFLAHNIQTKFMCVKANILVDPLNRSIKKQKSILFKELSNLNVNYKKICDYACIEFAKSHNLDSDMVIDLYNQTAINGLNIKYSFYKSASLDTFYKNLRDIAAAKFINAINIKNNIEGYYNDGTFNIKYPPIEIVDIDVTLNEEFIESIKNISNRLDMSNNFVYDNFFEHISNELNVPVALIKQMYLNDTWQSYYSDIPIIKMHTYINRLKPFIQDFLFERDATGYTLMVIPKYNFIQYIDHSLITFFKG